jgi:rSAM/selenodomain-associated transferase 2
MRAMTISIIIPTLNECASIGATLKSVAALAADCEVIVVDGGSVDGTQQVVASFGYRCCSSPRGRAAQMNSGAAHATGDILLFLHADTTLPQGFDSNIRNALANSDIAGGCFRLQFDCDQSFLRLCSWSTRFKLPMLHYGDSAYFVRAEVFATLGGYCVEFPIMEDIDFFLRLTRSFNHVVLDAAVVTSARRFLKDGTTRRQLTNMVLVSLFLLGVHPRRLARFYTHILPSAPSHGLSPLRVIPQKLLYIYHTLWHWAYSNIHLIGQTYYVVDFMKLHKLRAGELQPSHPWVTGYLPNSSDVVWDKNIVYASEEKSDWIQEPESDSAIAVRLGRFLALMVKRSTASTPELPQGSKRRMPHGVNYIHGSIHYNGGLLIFNDFADGIHHLSDTRFVKEMKRFVRMERRELTLVLRERCYDPEEFAWFVTFVRAHIPWFANGNGPTQKRVLFGTPSPYAAVNPINGSWVRDLQLLSRGDVESIVRPPITAPYFRERYNGTQADFTFLERFHAWAQHLQILAKGFQGGLVFTSRKKIEPENYKKYRETNGLWRASYRISHPFARIKSVRARRVQASITTGSDSEVRVVGVNPTHVE